MPGIFSIFLACCVILYPIHHYHEAYLVGLHACGDLTNSMMSWFCSSDHIATMSVISCCYHKMKTFPVSHFFKKIISNPDLRSHFALRLACQERLCHWINQSDIEHQNHWLTFSKRSILEKVCAKLNVHPRNSDESIFF